MIYRGKVSNGHIVLDADVSLPDGTEVEVVVHGQLPDKPATSEKTLLDVLRPFVGAVDEWPSDMSTNHDHYLYGTPKPS
ncbi:MAG: hypothetical protein KatS3mg111_3890 [Pirellulaceae bacterium]|nr:MAG: hypothetical protein KatS3mg111_3890 [Pirellulaceae bacterium]